MMGESKYGLSLTARRALVGYEGQWASNFSHVSV